MLPTVPTVPVCQRIENLYSHLMRKQTPETLSLFRDSYNSLSKDIYFPETAGVRERRYGQFLYAPNGERVRALDHRPFTQSKAHNSLFGDIDRHFDPLLPVIQEGVFLDCILDYLIQFLPPLEQCWKVNVHQMRVHTSSSSQQGLPAPEGLHLDGHDFIALLMVQRKRVGGGANIVCDQQKNILLETTLLSPFEGLLLNDRKTLHRVTPIVAEDSAGYRDMLIIDFNQGDPF